MRTSISSVQRSYWATLFCLVIVWLATGSASSQEVPPPFEFSLTNAGARSLGFGGAFAARADDATAAFTNPAGLIQILQPEVSAEIRQIYHRGTAGGWNLLGEFTSLGFVSAALPVGSWSIAGYFNRTARSVVIINADGSDYVIDSYGASVAYRLTDSLSIGIGVSQYSENDKGVLDDLLGDSSAPLGLSPADNRRTKSKARGLNAGFLWRVNNQWNVGGFYREGPELALNLPDVYGLGGSYRTKDGAVILSFEWDRVQYSTLLASFDPALSDVSGLVLADADELHVGAEYVFLQTSPIKAIRCGVWLDPDHQARAVSEPPGSDELHFTLGFGLAWKRAQLDIGLDISEQEYIGSVSAVFSF
jgi:long-subunit fatty acid transport protein